jgi:murein DD-endopeptidase MepM/ murein hydrolase activator NlpD
MRTRPFVIAAAAAAAVGAGLGVAVIPASAQQRTLVVTLASGRTMVVSVAAAPGTPVSQIRIPGVDVPIVSVKDATPPPAPTQTQQTPTQTQTQTTPPTKTTPKPPAGGKKPSSAGPKVRQRPSRAHSRPGPKSRGSRGGSRGRGGGRARGGANRTGDRPVFRPLRRNGGIPTPANPTFSLATPGPAPIGVPNFFIDRFRIPPFLLPIYQAAGIEYGIPWQVLAAVNEIETDYGRNLNVSSAGALGWMQFMPATWKAYGVDANGDGREDPFNPVDAIFAAARYLRAAGGEKDLKKAIFAYNHADWYVQSVLLRAKLIGGLPPALVGSLTGLTQAHFPVAAKARYANDLDEANATKRAKKGTNAALPVSGNGRRRGIRIFADKKAPVIAVNDGKIVAVGQNERLGKYVVLQDVYGNKFTYGHLGSVSKYYAVPKEKKVSAKDIAKELELPAKDPKPTLAASAGAQPRKLPKAVKRAAKSPNRPAAPQVKVRKERLYAYPQRPHNRPYGGAKQLRAAAAAKTPKITTFKDYFTVPLGLNRKDVVLKRLKPGARVIGGTILGRIDKTENLLAPNVYFEIRPAGKGAPRVDPKPILDGWKLLEATAIYRAADKNPFFGSDAKNPSIGQVLLMSKEALQTRVLADPRIDIYSCGRRDIRSGRVDRRVLATTLYLRLSGVVPTITSLSCGHSFMTASGNVSEHSTGTAMDIAKVNNIPIMGHQGKGSITDLTIRRLLLLQGTMKPHQIISLMRYKGTDNTLSLPDHNDHIHVGFRPQFGSNAKLGRQVAEILKPGQWLKLVDRLNEIPNPNVRVKPSKYALRVRKGAAGKDD